MQDVLSHPVAFSTGYTHYFQRGSIEFYRKLMTLLVKQILISINKYVNYLYYKELNIHVKIFRNANISMYKNRYSLEIPPGLITGYPQKAKSNL